MMASRYINPFKDEATFWTLKMSFCAEVGESGCRGASCLDVPRGRLHHIGEFARQELPREAKRFQSIDKNWEKIMQKALETRNVIQYCFGNDVLKNLLPFMLEQLEVCQKALSGYLDQKRSALATAALANAALDTAGLATAALATASLASAALDTAATTAASASGLRRSPHRSHLFQRGRRWQPQHRPII